MNRRLMMQQQAKKRLPADYTELKYIVGTGAQWFDTGVYAENEYTGARYKYSQSQKKPYGAYILSGSGFPAFPFLRQSGAGILVNRTISQQIPFPFDVNTDYEFFTNEKGDVFLNDEFITSIGNNKPVNPFQSTIKCGVYYGETWNTAHYALIGNLYYVQIFQNGEIVRDFVPCINPDGIVGMYDLVDGGFYKSATSTNYQAGEVA